MYHWWVYKSWLHRRFERLFIALESPDQSKPDHVEFMSRQVPLSVGESEVRQPTVIGVSTIGE